MIMAQQEPGSPQTKGGSAIATTATASAADQNVSRYFKQLLRARPELLEERSNDAIYSIWLADHPGHKEVPKKVQQGLSNVKSILRKEMGTKSPRRRKGKRGRKAKAKVAILSNGAAPAAVRAPRGSTKELEALELLIDDCLVLAQDRRRGSGNGHQLSAQGSYPDRRSARFDSLTRDTGCLPAGPGRQEPPGRGTPVSARGRTSCPVGVFSSRPGDSSCTTFSH